MNLYGYVGNNPVNGIDPLGLYITYAPGDYTNFNNQFAGNWQNPAFQNRWNQMQNSPYDFHYSPNNTPNQLTSITGSGDLRVDTDGTGPSHGDPTHQNETSMRRNGRCLNADTDPYLVAPLGLENFGVRAGNPATMTANGQVLNAPIGDFGPAGNGFGEASVAGVHNLGVQTRDVRGVGPVIPGAGVPTTVTVYPSGRIR